MFCQDMHLMAVFSTFQLLLRNHHLQIIELSVSKSNLIKSSCVWITLVPMKCSYWQIDVLGGNYAEFFT